MRIIIMNLRPSYISEFNSGKNSDNTNGIQQLADVNSDCQNVCKLSRFLKYTVYKNCNDTSSDISLKQNNVIPYF